jgi:hypothetical protein
VLWLRPEYQIPPFGSDAERVRLEEERRRARQADMARAAQRALAFYDDLQEIKPQFPTGDELVETAAVNAIADPSANLEEKGPVEGHR